MRRVLVAAALTVPLLAGAAEARECYQRFASGLVQSNIADIQDQLARHGYAPGPVTGLVNKTTCLAVLAYQRDARLEATGILDPMLQNQLHFGTPFVRAPNSVDPATRNGAAADLAPDLQDAPDAAAALPDATAALPDEPRGTPPPRPPVLITPEPAPALGLPPAAPGTGGPLSSDTIVPYPPPPPAYAPPAPPPAANPDDETHT